MIAKMGVDFDFAQADNVIVSLPNHARVSKS